MQPGVATWHGHQDADIEEIAARAGGGHQQIKWFSMLTGWPPPIVSLQQGLPSRCTDNLFPASDPGEHAAQAHRDRPGTCL
eukprot:2577523-Karenia_brevis.AAC.1